MNSSLLEVPTVAKISGLLGSDPSYHLGEGASFPGGFAGSGSHRESTLVPQEWLVIPDCLGVVLQLEFPGGDVLRNLFLSFTRSFVTVISVTWESHRVRRTFSGLAYSLTRATGRASHLLGLSIRPVPSLRRTSHADLLTPALLNLGGQSGCVGPADGAGWRTQEEGRGGDGDGGASV